MMNDSGRRKVGSSKMPVAGESEAAEFSSYTAEGLTSKNS